MDKLQIAKKIIKENFEYGDLGLFDSINITGDSMYTIYNEDGLQIDICYYYSYFEVFGLSENEFEELQIYYREVLGGVLM